MRFDDTNPEKEEAKFFTAICDMVAWLGMGWECLGRAGGQWASPWAMVSHWVSLVGCLSNICVILPQVTHLIR